MKRWVSIVTLILLVVLAVPVCATSLQGMKGLMVVPSADTPAEGKYGLNFQLVNGSDSILSFNYGIWENFEIFASLDSTDKFSESELNGGLKARVLRETRVQPSLALGLRGRDLFVVASKMLDYKTNIRGHLGFGTGTFDGLYFGFNKLYNPITISSSDASYLIPVTNFKIDYMQSEINLGADFLFNEHFVLNFGVLNLRELTYGIGYTSVF